MGKVLIRLLFLLNFTLLMIACNESTCTESTIVNANLYFYNEVNNSALAFDSITVKGINQKTDSILYNNRKGVKNIALPLHALSELTIFEVDYKKSNGYTTSEKDTIRLYHKNNPYYISSECGCSVFATLDSVITTHHRIKSINIIKSEITNLNEKHISVLY